jgi:hypothetical protein
VNLLENAIHSTRLYLQDYSAESDDRLLSAVRNLHAGILLLYKEKLHSLSPAGNEEALLKQKIVP